MTDNNELSERELEILRLVATGASNKDIANELVISVNTVKVHLRNIFNKIEVSSRTEATMWAVRSGVVEDLIDPETIQQNEQSDQDINVESQPVNSGKFSSRWLFLGFFIIIFIVVGGIIFLNWQRSRTQENNAILTVEPGRWQALTKLSSPRSNFAYTTYNNQIYIFAGIIGEGISSSSERYEVDANAWFEISPKPIPVKDVSAVVLGGQIYIPGGETADGEIISEVEIYNSQDDSWAKVAPLPSPRSAYALAAFEGKLFVFGGWDGSVFTDTVFEYDPIQDMWRQRSSIPTARGFSGAATVGDNIYIFGGFDGVQALAVNEIFSPGNQDNPWSVGNSLPQGRYAMGVTALVDTVYLLGGISDEGKITSSFEYKSVKNEWGTITNPFTQKWSSMGIVSIGTNIYIFGGELDGALSDQMWYYQAIYSISIPVIQQ